LPQSVASLEISWHLILITAEKGGWACNSDWLSWCVWKCY